MKKIIKNKIVCPWCNCLCLYTNKEVIKNSFNKNTEIECSHCNRKIMVFPKYFRERQYKKYL